MIQLFYTVFSCPLNEQVYLKYLSGLPEGLKKKNQQYARWQDKHANLFGKLLLLEGLQLFKYDSDALNNINYNKYNRPFLNDKIEFNISHSGQYVVCAIASDVKLGIDIEEVKETDFADFKEVMTDEQWKCIMKATYSTKEFFRYWTIKESVIKADSRGMSIPLTNIHVMGNMASCEDKFWYIKEVELDGNYCCHLACNKADIKINIQRVNFFD